MAKSTYSFLVIGYYGAGNLGDELILSTILSGLKAYTSEENICVTTYDPEYTHSVHGNVQTVAPDDLFRLADVIKNSSLMIIGAGGLFTDDAEVFGSFNAASAFDDPTGGISLYFACSKMAKMHGVPYLILSTSISSIHNPENNILLAEIFENAGAVYMRDKASVDFARKLAPQNASILLTADPVFRWSSGKTSQGKTKLNKKAIVSIRKWANLPQSFYDAFGKTLSDLEKRGYKLLFVPFQTGSTDLENDITAIDEIIAANRLSNYEVKKEVTLDKDALVELYEQADVVVGMRLHSIILAMNFAKPFLAFAYDPKITNLLQGTSLKDLCISPNQSNTQNLASTLLKNKTATIKAEQALVRKARKLADAPFEWIAQNISLLPDGDFAALTAESARSNRHIREHFYEEIQYYKNELEKSEQELAKLQRRANVRLRALAARQIRGVVKLVSNNKGYLPGVEMQTPDVADAEQIS